MSLCPSDALKPVKGIGSCQPFSGLLTTWWLERRRDAPLNNYLLKDPEATSIILAALELNHQWLSSHNYLASVQDSCESCGLLNLSLLESLKNDSDTDQPFFFLFTIPKNWVWCGNHFARMRQKATNRSWNPQPWQSASNRLILKTKTPTLVRGCTQALLPHAAVSAEELLAQQVGQRQWCFIHQPSCPGDLLSVHGQQPQVSSTGDDPLSTETSIP